MKRVLVYKLNEERFEFLNVNDRKQRKILKERAETGITDGMVRVSVGLEHVDDIIRDIHQALG